MIKQELVNPIRTSLSYMYWLILKELVNYFRAGKALSIFRSSKNWLIHQELVNYFRTGECTEKLVIQLKNWLIHYPGYGESIGSLAIPGTFILIFMFRFFHSTWKKI